MYFLDRSEPLYFVYRYELKQCHHIAYHPLQEDVSRNNPLAQSSFCTRGWTDNLKRPHRRMEEAAGILVVGMVDTLLEHLSQATPEYDNGMQLSDIKYMYSFIVRW